MSVSGEVNDAEIEALLSNAIGTPGGARAAYRMYGASDRIIKSRQDDRYRSNRIEWEIWQEIVGSKVSHLFGECFAISKSGRYFVMEYLSDLETADLSSIPPLPTWLRDRKIANLGKAADGSIKVRDYGLVDPWTNRSSAPLVSWPSRADVADMTEVLAALALIKSNY